MWIIIIIGSLCLATWFLWENFGWKCTLRLLSNYYIDARENDNLSAKEAFLKALTTKFRLKKTSELMKELKERGVTDENQIKQEIKKLLWRNAWRQNAEYGYQAILNRKGFFEEAAELKFSRSPIEGSIRAGEDVGQNMWCQEWNVEDDNNYGLMELLICGLIVENYKVKKKNYNNIISKMIRNNFKGQDYVEKYLNEPQTIIKKEVNYKQILDEHMAKLKSPKEIEKVIKSAVDKMFTHIRADQERKLTTEKVCPRCKTINSPVAFRCKNEDCLDILPHND